MRDDFAYPTSVAESAPAPGSHRELDDDYHHVVARLDPLNRVVRCRDAIQWVLQVRSEAKDGSGLGGWRNAGFFLTRDALVAAATRRATTADPAAVATLAALPEHFPRRAR